MIRRLKPVHSICLLALAFSGCEFSSSNNVGSNSSAASPKAAKAVAKPLDPSSPKDVIQAKYDHLSLDCELQLQATSGGNTSQSSDSQSLDLLNDYSDTFTLNFKTNLDGVMSTASLTINKIEITGTTFTSTSPPSITYTMTNSPMLSGVFSEEDGSESGQVYTKALGDVSLLERVPSQITATSGEVSSGLSRTSSLNCTLNAVPKAAYANQFTQSGN